MHDDDDDDDDMYQEFYKILQFGKRKPIKKLYFIMKHTECTYVSTEKGVYIRT